MSDGCHPTPQRLLAFVPLIAAIIAAGLAVTACGSSESTASGSQSASFLGDASNAAVFIQWTRNGSHLAGSLQEALRGESESASVEASSRAFTGTINGHGLTLTLNEGLGSARALVGTLSGRGFALTFPGTHHNLITIRFAPAHIAAYNTAVAALEAPPQSTAATGRNEEEGEESAYGASDTNTGNSPVEVVRCPTSFAAAAPTPHVPSSLPSSSEAAKHHLVAYTNTQLYMLGPKGMNCSGAIDADGNTQIVAWPSGDPRPKPHSEGDGLTLSLDPACAGCRAAEGCPFFTTLARELGFPCTSGVPAGEIVHSTNPRTVLFEDPPGRAGSGWPSGGADPANGVVGLTGEREVYRATCTLPAAEHAVCTAVLDDVIARYS